MNSNQWIIRNGSVTHKVTNETCEFGLNGEIYDIQVSGNSAGFSALIRNVVVANRIIRQSNTQFDPEVFLQSGEELVVRLPISMLESIKSMLKIPNLKQQLVIANRS